MSHLTRNDYAGALRLLARVERQTGDESRFAHAVVQALHDYVAAELTTLSVCDLQTGHRRVVGLPGTPLGADEMACFNQHFFEPPLTRRRSDLVSRHDFQRSPRYADDHRRLELEYAIVMLLFKDKRAKASVVLNRRGVDFDERDRERLDLLRPHLAFLYRQAHQAGASPAVDAPSSRLPVALDISACRLTQRETEVMHWLACGKTDVDIAALLAISPRTVQKHLEHVYVKLGVETRTAAVMRALAIHDHPVLPV